MYNELLFKRNNTEIKTNALIFTFNTPKISDSLKNGYLNIPVMKYHSMFLFSKLVQFIEKSHGQRVMNYADATKPPIQSTSVCTQTDVSWVGAQPVTEKQRPAASVTSRPVQSVLRSVVTPTRVADVKKNWLQFYRQLRRMMQNQVNILHQSNMFHLFMSLIHILQLKQTKRKEFPLLTVFISPPLSSRLPFWIRNG